MPRSNKNDTQELAQDLASSLKATTELIYNLMDDIKENATSFAVLKEKMESLSDSVESLSHIVRDGNGKGSMITRLALYEQSLDNISEKLDDFVDETQETIKELKSEIKNERALKHSSTEKDRDFKRKIILERLKVVAIVAPGLIALSIMLIKLFAGVE
jgi:gas vesicle protein